MLYVRLSKLPNKHTMCITFQNFRSLIENCVDPVQLASGEAS